MAVFGGPRNPSRRQLLRAGVVVALAGACRGATPDQRAVKGRPTPAAAGPTAFHGGQVYRNGAFTPATIVVDGGRITDVSDEAAPDVQSHDATGLWLIPGFIDAHVHLQFAPPSVILAGGVTTVRDLGSPPAVAQDAAGESLLRVQTVGRILTTVGGYPSQSWGADGTSRQVSDATDAQQAVAEQLSDGASTVKIALDPSTGPLFDPEVLAALIAAAHGAGTNVTAHVGSAEALALAIEHGVDELAHLPLYDVTPAEMVTVAEAGIVLVPTLEIRGRDRAALAAVSAFVSAGGTVVYGTDLGNTGTSPGIEQPELRAMLDARMSPGAVLDAATSVAADHLGLSDVGRIEAGAAADFIGLRGDPLSDPAAYDDIALVIARGVQV